MVPTNPVRPTPTAPPAPAAPATLTAGAREGVATSAFKRGDRLGQLDIGDKLGEGLHGEVFLAVHRHTGDRFALKAMRLEDAQDAGKVQRHLRTAKASYRIRCSNVVTVHDLGCEDSGVVWVLMELLEGRSVAALLAAQQGRVSLPLAFHVAIGAAWGVDAAHDLSVIHRDIKPANLWLCADGTVKVIDFGLAKVVPDGVQTTKRTAAGTLPYMARELLAGDDFDARVDVYALGVVLWEMLGGRHPWADALAYEAEMVRRVLHEELPSLSAASGLPAYVDDFMARAVAQDRARRFLSVAAMAQGMMTLRDRLLEDAERGLFTPVQPSGEPVVPGDSHGRREHAARQPVPSHAAPQEEPCARVVLAAPAPVSPLGPGGTVPFRPLRRSVPRGRCPTARGCRSQRRRRLPRSRRSTTRRSPRRTPPRARPSFRPACRARGRAPCRSRWRWRWAGASRSCSHANPRAVAPGTLGRCWTGRHDHDPCAARRRLR